MPKISALPQQSTPATTDKMPVVSGGQTSYELLSDLITTFFNNIPAGAHSDVTRGGETIFNHVASGGVITADSAGVNRNASMTAMVIYINGRRISVSAVSARTYTASKDTYVDVLDNLDGTGTLVYTETTNNAASAALAANSVRVGIVVTGATTIAAAASINQGSEDRVLPIVTSIPYAVTDSLGNLICPRDPSRKLLGYRQVVAVVTTVAPTTSAAVTGLTAPIIVPTGRKVKISVDSGLNLQNSGANTTSFGVCLTSAADANRIKQFNIGGGVAVAGEPVFGEVVATPAATSVTYVAHVQASSGNAIVNGNAISPAFIKIELE